MNDVVVRERRVSRSRVIVLLCVANSDVQQSVILFIVDGCRRVRARLLYGAVDVELNSRFEGVSSTGFVVDCREHGMKENELFSLELFLLDENASIDGIIMRSSVLERAFMLPGSEGQRSPLIWSKGWYDPEPSGEGVLRWMSQTGRFLLIRLGHADQIGFFLEGPDRRIPISTETISVTIDGHVCHPGIRAFDSAWSLWLRVDPHPYRRIAEIEIVSRIPAVVPSQVDRRGLTLLASRADVSAQSLSEPLLPIRYVRGFSDSEGPEIQLGLFGEFRWMLGIRGECIVEAEPGRYILEVVFRSVTPGQTASIFLDNLSLGFLKFSGDFSAQEVFAVTIELSSNPSVLSILLNVASTASASDDARELGVLVERMSLTSEEHFFDQRRT